MKRSCKIFVLLVLLVAVSCGQQGRKASLETDSAVQERKFPMVPLPAMIQDSQQAAEYMAMHYWDALCSHILQPDSSEDFLRDSLHVEGVRIGDLEQSLANYIYILESLPLKTAQKAVAHMADVALSCERADSSSNIFETIVRMTEKYMYDPNSPLRDEDLYSPFAARMAQNPSYDQAARDRYDYIAGMCRLNERGTKAADFRFCDKAGRIHTLYGITADHILLFFSNPGCTSCLDIINTLKSDEVVNRLLSEGSLKVLNIYIDEDLQAWKKYMPVYPEQWYNGFDPDMKIRNEKIYSVRAIPSLYLLDKDKKVILKDTTPERLMATLHTI